MIRELTAADCAQINVGKSASLGLFKTLAYRYWQISRLPLLGLAGVSLWLDAAFSPQLELLLVPIWGLFLKACVQDMAQCIPAPRPANIL